MNSMIKKNQSVNVVLSLSVGQKQHDILSNIHKAFHKGHLRYDISWHGSIYSITDREGIRSMLDYFYIYPLHTCKNVDVVTFKRLLYMLDNKFQSAEHPLKHKLINLVRLFKKRNINL
jgi:hypothetical protein